MRRCSELAELVVVLGEREPAVQVDLQRLGGDVGSRHVGVDPRVDPHRPGHRSPLARELGDGLVQELEVELEPDGCDVARLLRAEQVARAADLEIAHRGVVGEGREPRPRLR